MNEDIEQPDDPQADDVDAVAPVDPPVPEPAPLEALQRDMAAFAQEDQGPPPEPVPLTEPPAAAGQPEEPYIAPLDLPEPEAPEIELPPIEMPEELKELVDEIDAIPDISSTPPPRKPSAWQKRHGQVPAQPEQPAAPPEGQANPAPPNFRELHKVAQDLGAVDENGFVDFEKLFPPPGDQQDVNQGQPEVNDLRGAQNDANQALLTVLNTNIECLRTLMLGLADCQRQLSEIRLGQQRRRR
jgi:hypothetical protein